MNTSAAGRVPGCTRGAVDYRMPPDHPYPAPLDDCVAVYRALLERPRPSEIIVGGGSAGGNLAAALMLRARTRACRCPAALVLAHARGGPHRVGRHVRRPTSASTPCSDRASPRRTCCTPAATTSPIPISRRSSATSRRLPADVPAGRDARPLPLQRGAHAPQAARAGVQAELHIFEAMPHGGFFGAPEDAEIAVEVRRFLAKHGLAERH